MFFLKYWRNQEDSGAPQNGFPTSTGASRTIVKVRFPQALVRFGGARLTLPPLSVPDLAEPPNSFPPLGAAAIQGVRERKVVHVVF